jgi:hypothetical protein
VRDIARRAPAASPRRGLLAAAAAVALLLATAGPAAAASPPTITSAFTPAEIGVGDSIATALSVTIANPNTSGTLSSVAFTDTLPAGLTIDNPNGENGTCGTAGVITAAPGTASLSLSGGSVKPGASCTISVSVIAAQPGTYTNATSSVSSSAGSSAAGDTKTLTVLPPPTLAVKGIKEHATFTFRQSVKPTYVCAQAVDPAALADCSATDELGNTIDSGHALDTREPGQHTLSVSASSTDGLSTTDSFDYTVLPDNRFTVSAVTPKAHGALRLKLGLPGAGTARITETAVKGVVAGKATTTIARKRTLTVRVTPTAAGRKLLTAATGTQKTSHTASVRVRLTVTYTPKGGVKKTIIKRGIRLKTS